MYVPKAELERFGYTEDQLFQGVYNDSFVALMENMLIETDDDLAITLHGQRQTVNEEFDYMLSLIDIGNPYISSRYSKESLIAERDFIEHKALGDIPLFATGIFIRKNMTGCNRFFDEWWSRCIEFSSFDQAMFCYMAAIEEVIKINAIPWQTLFETFLILHKHKQQPLAMKTTDYSPRAAVFDTYLTPTHKIGVEIGVDAGAHAEALLSYQPQIEKLFLIDPWPKEIFMWYAKGRLETKGFMKKIEFINKKSGHAVERFKFDSLDFIYFDQEHDYNSVKEDLEIWWEKLKDGGILGYRNYAATNVGLYRAVNEFVAKNNLDLISDNGEAIIIK